MLNIYYYLANPDHPGILFNDAGEVLSAEALTSKTRLCTVIIASTLTNYWLTPQADLGNDYNYAVQFPAFFLEDQLLDAPEDYCVESAIQGNSLVIATCPQQIIQTALANCAQLNLTPKAIFPETHLWVTNTQDNTNIHCPWGTLRIYLDATPLLMLELSLIHI